MKHHADKMTLELPDMPKKRGRPATGQALSTAERVRAYRERQRASGNVQFMLTRDEANEACLVILNAIRDDPTSVWRSLRVEAYLKLGGKAALLPASTIGSEQRDPE